MYASENENYHVQNAVSNGLHCGVRDRNRENYRDLDREGEMEGESK